MLFVDGVIVFICAKNDVVNVTVITHFFVCYYVYLILLLQNYENNLNFKKITMFFEIVNCHPLIINPTPKCSRSLTDCILGSATVACGNIGSTTLKAQGQIIHHGRRHFPKLIVRYCKQSTTLEEHVQIAHQGRRPCFATRR